MSNSILGSVFILQSIKPRVETLEKFRKSESIPLSLSYNPSNQGLKPSGLMSLYRLDTSLYPTIHQTKGWNITHNTLLLWAPTSLSYNPSNQGLKLVVMSPSAGWSEVFILQSIKPRVETPDYMRGQFDLVDCLYPTIHQPKGWNSATYGFDFTKPKVFILQSIKPRVETWRYGNRHLQ